MEKGVTVFFTGGGSSGHVTPNIALIEKAQALGWQVCYIGTRNGIEKELIAKENIKNKEIKYHTISSGKLRRYFSWKTFVEPFKISCGIIQSLVILGRAKPQLLFSKGGFVAFPAVLAAWLLRIPVVVHESDLYPGLANRLSFPFCNKICITFSETKQRIKNNNRVEVTGAPVREAFFQGEPERAEVYCDFKSREKKTLLIYGGGLGAQVINETVRELLPSLLSNFNMIHLCGKGKVDENYADISGYKQFEYLYDELFDVMALADIVISRAGSNSLYELLVLKKPHILIPLSKKASRGDQIENAAYFEKKGLSVVVNEEALTKQTLLTAVKEVDTNIEEYKKRMEALAMPAGTSAVLDVICSMIARG